MEYIVVRENNRVQIALRGPITVQEADDFKQHLLLTPPDVQSITFDCREVSNIDLCMLQLLVAFQQHRKEEAIIHIIDSPAGIISDTLQRTGMGHISGWPSETVKPTIA